MLILSRKVKERIILGNGEITFTIVEMGGSQVKVGIDAPKDIPVHREEIFNLIKEKGEIKDDK
jgi:carbon storage regulator